VPFLNCVRCALSFGTLASIATALGPRLYEIKVRTVPGYGLAPDDNPLPPPPGSGLPGAKAAPKGMGMGAAAAKAAASKQERADKRTSEAAVRARAKRGLWWWDYGAMDVASIEQSTTTVADGPPEKEKKKTTEAAAAAASPSSTSAAQVAGSGPAPLPPPPGPPPGGREARAAERDAAGAPAHKVGGVKKRKGGGGAGGSMSYATGRAETVVRRGAVMRESVITFEKPTAKEGSSHFDARPLSVWH